MLPQSHPHILQTAGSLAADLRGLGEFSKALGMDRATYESLKDVFGEDHPSTLSAANNLAVDLRWSATSTPPATWTRRPGPGGRRC